MIGHRRPHWPAPLLAPQASPLPVGTIIAYAGQLPPAAGPHVMPDIEAWGWMLCDGRGLSCVEYGELYAALGGLYGQTGAPDRFCIPDLRGYFLRGADPEARVDRDAPQRKPAGSGAAADVGSRQDAALQDHVHLPSPGGVPVPLVGPPTPMGVSPKGPSTPPAPGGEVLISLSETRPVNLSVHYLIRFTNRLLLT